MAISFDEFWSNVQANAPGVSFDQARQVYRDKIGLDPVLTEGPTLKEFRANVAAQYPDAPQEQVEATYHNVYRGFGQLEETGRGLVRGRGELTKTIGRGLGAPAELLQGLGKSWGLGQEELAAAQAITGWNVPQQAGQALVDWGKDVVASAPQSVARSNLQAESRDQFLGEFRHPSLWAPSVGEMAPGMAGMLAVGRFNPGLGAAVGGGQEASGKYDELIAQGVDPETARKEGLGYGATTIPLNLLPLEAMLGPRMVANKWANRALVGGLEATTEAAEPAAYSLLTEGDPLKAAQLWGQEFKGVGPAAFLTGAALGGGRGAPQRQPEPRTAEAGARSALEGLRPTQEPQEALEPTPAPTAVPEPISAQGEATPSQAPEPIVPRKPPAPQPEGEPMPGQRFPERAMEVVTARGNRVPAVPVLVELGALTTSSQEGYDPTLQPRDRSQRSAMQQQERDIASKLDPMRLRPAVDADRGAPIVRRDGQVLSGNGRVNALRLAIQQFPERYQAYVADLAAQGYPVEGMQNPALVMEAQGENNWTAFTKEANESATSRMSPLETARADASRLTEQQLSLYQGGEVDQAGNRDFVRSFLGTLPQSEQNALVDQGGKLSPEGVRRIQAALLARAYGGTAEANATLARALESTDNNTRSQTGALLDAAPKFAGLRTEIDAGRIRPEFDITDRLAQAVEILSQLRSQGRALREYLDQQGLFGQLPAETEALLRAMHNPELTRAIGRDRLAEVLRFYANQAAQAGRADQQGLFGETADQVTPQALLEQAGQLFQEAPAPSQAAMFAQRGQPPARPLPISLTRQFLNQAIRKWTNGPRVALVEHSSELPVDVLQAIGADSPAAYYVPTKTVYIVADKITSPFVLARALAHEAVGHHGFIEIMGDRWDWTTGQVNRLAERDAIVRQIAAEVDELYGAAFDANPTDAYNIRAAEIVARLAERSPKHPLIKRLVAQLREFLRKLGFRVNLSYNDLVYLLNRSAQSLSFEGVKPIQKGRPGAGQRPGWEGVEAADAMAMRVTPINPNGERRNRTVDVMKNPRPETLQQLFRDDKELQEAYAEDQDGEPPFRMVVDAEGNRYVWPSWQSVHPSMKRGLEQQGVKFNENNARFPGEPFAWVDQNGTTLGYHRNNAWGLDPLKVPPGTLAMRVRPLLPSGTPFGKDVDAIVNPRPELLASMVKSGEVRWRGRTDAAEYPFRSLTDLDGQVWAWPAEQADHQAMKDGLRRMGARFQDKPTMDDGEGLRGMAAWSTLYDGSEGWFDAQGRHHAFRDVPKALALRVTPITEHGDYKRPLDVLEDPSNGQLASMVAEGEVDGPGYRYGNFRRIVDLKGREYFWPANRSIHGWVRRGLEKMGVRFEEARGSDMNMKEGTWAGYADVDKRGNIKRLDYSGNEVDKPMTTEVEPWQPPPPAWGQNGQGEMAFAQRVKPPQALAMTAAEQIMDERHGRTTLPLENPGKYATYERKLGDRARRELLRLREDAGAFKPLFDQTVHKIQDLVSPNAHKDSRVLQGGYGTPKLKGWDRIVEKLWLEEGGDWTELKDMLRATVFVRTLDEMQRALDVVTQAFGQAPGTNVRTWALDGTPDDSGYQDVKINVRGPNGRAYEIQINTPLMFDLKEEGGHLFYDEIRKIEGAAKAERRNLTRKEMERIALLRAQSRRHYEPARTQLAATSAGTLAPSATMGERMAGSQESPLSSRALKPSGESMNRREPLTQPSQSGPGLNTFASIQSPPDQSVPQTPTGSAPKSLAMRVVPISAFGRKSPPIDVMVNPPDQQLVNLVRTGDVPNKGFNFRQVIAQDGTEFIWPAGEELHDLVQRGLAQTGYQFNSGWGWKGWITAQRNGVVQRLDYNGIDRATGAQTYRWNGEPPDTLAQRVNPGQVWADQETAKYNASELGSFERQGIRLAAYNMDRIFGAMKPGEWYSTDQLRKVFKQEYRRLSPQGIAQGTTRSINALRDQGVIRTLWDESGDPFYALRETPPRAGLGTWSKDNKTFTRAPAVLAMADGGQRTLPGVQGLPERGDRTLEGEQGGRYRNLWSGGLNNDEFQLLAAMFDQLQPAIHTQRRGTVSWSETQQAALADLEARTGINLAEFMNLKPGAAVSAELLTKYAAMLAGTVQQAQQLAIEHNTNRSDDTRLALKATLERLAVMVPATYGAMTEAGRALNILKTAAPIARGAREIIEQMGEGEAINIDQMANVLTTANPREVLGVARALHHPTWWDKFYEVWVNGLLSGATTHAVNIISNELYKWLETASITVGYAVTSGADMRAIGARLAAMSDGVSLGLKNARRAWDTQEPVLTAAGKIETRYPRAIEGKVGNLVRTPGRALLAMDEFYKAQAYQMELAMSVMERAIELAPQNPMALYQDMMANPETTFLQHPEILERAHRAADKLTFTTKLGPLAGALNHYLNKSKVGKLIVPFVRTPTNIVKSTLEYMPLGAVSKSTRDALLGRGSTHEVAVARGRQIVGAGLGLLVIQAAAQGLMSGAGPDDPAERQLLYRTGWQPYSIKWGDTWYRYNRFEPLGMLFGIAADMYEVGSAADDKELDTLAGMVVTSFANNLGDKTFLRGISDFVQAYTDPERYGNKWVQGMAGTVVPTAVAQLAYAQDPFQRQANTVVDAIRARIPGEREKLAARVDIAGERVGGTGSVAGVATNPLRPSEAQQDPLSRTMLELGVYKRAPSNKLYDVKLSDQEYEEYATWLGQVRQRMLTPYVQSPQFQALKKQNPVQAAKLLEQQWDKLSSEARVKYLYDHPALYSKAYQLRQPGSTVRSSRYLQ